MTFPDDPGAWEAELGRAGRVEVGYRRLNTMVLAVVAVLFTLGGVLVTASGDTGRERVTGILGAALFGVVAVILLRRGVQGGPAAVVTASDVGAPSQGWTLPWEHVYGAFVFRSRRTATVCVAVEPDWMEHHLATAGRAARVLAAGNRRLMGVEAVSLPTPLAVDPDAFAAWLSTRALARPPGQD